MLQVTISKKEYTRLRKESAAYRKITARLFEAVVRDPIDEVVEDFRKTNLYTDGFMRDLELGLRRSSYGKS